MTLGLLPDFQNSMALRYFYESARYGSYKLASEKIHIAASAISRQIQLLEEELNVKLFLRDRKSLRLTPAGEVLLYRVKRVMDELKKAKAEISELVGDLTGTVRMGINETVARELLPSFLDEFRRHHPKITIELLVGNSDELVELLARHDVDVIVGYAMASTPKVKHVSSHRLSTCITVRSDHPLARRSSIRISDVVDLPMIIPSNGSVLRRLLDAVFTRLAVNPQATLVSNSFELTAALVTAGRGVGWQVRMHSGRDPVRPGIVYVPVSDAGSTDAILACSILADVRPHAALAICLEVLQKCIEDWIHQPNIVADATPEL
jgi:DNA-binding transcriptional LysR family regulator